MRRSHGSVHASAGIQSQYMLLKGCKPERENANDELGFHVAVLTLHSMRTYLVQNANPGAECLTLLHAVGCEHHRALSALAAFLLRLGLCGIYDEVPHGSPCPWVLHTQHLSVHLAIDHTLVA